MTRLDNDQEIDEYERLHNLVLSIKNSIILFFNYFNKYISVLMDQIKQFNYKLILKLGKINQTPFRVYKNSCPEKNSRTKYFLRKGR